MGQLNPTNTIVICATKALQQSINSNNLCIGLCIHSILTTFVAKPGGVGVPVTALPPITRWKKIKTQKIKNNKNETAENNLSFLSFSNLCHSGSIGCSKRTDQVLWNTLTGWYVTTIFLLFTVSIVEPAFLFIVFLKLFRSAKDSGVLLLLILESAACCPLLFT